MYNYFIFTQVIIGRQAKKQLRSVPQHVVAKLAVWVDAVETSGLETVRRFPGFHDEPLKGDRKGQRSIRLSRSHRAFYMILHDGSCEFVSVEEVNKHAY